MNEDKQNIMAFEKVIARLKHFVKATQALQADGHLQDLIEEADDTDRLIKYVRQLEKDKAGSKNKIDDLGDRISGAMMNKCLELGKAKTELLAALKPFSIAPDDPMIKPREIDGVKYPQIDPEPYVTAHQVYNKHKGEQNEQ